MAFNCSIPGIFNDIHPRIINGPTNFFQYGLFIGLGTPSQNSSIWPSIVHNDTSFRSVDYCSTGSSPQCRPESNSEVNLEHSTTWQPNPSYRPLDDSSWFPNVTRTFGNDTLDIWTHYFDGGPVKGTYLQQMPVTIVSNYTSSEDPFFKPGGTLGLGTASTVLDRLRKDKLIASKSYALHIGTGYSRNGGDMNGSLVFGGYDSTRFLQPLYTNPLVPASSANGFSPFKVNIASMSLDLAPGKSVNLVENGGFDAYLTTSQYPVQFPRSVTQKIASTLSGAPANNIDNTLSIRNAAGANLTITMSNGLKVVLDSAWLSNTSNISPISAAPLQGLDSSNSSTFQSSNLPIMLGAAFMQQLYLFVSYESSPPSFSLANINWNTKYVQQQGFCPGSTPTPATAPKLSSFAQNGLIGAVIACIIGGLAAIGLGIFLTRMLLRKCSARKQIKLNDIENKPGSMKKRPEASRIPRALVTFSLRDQHPKSPPLLSRPKGMGRSDSTNSTSSDSSNNKYGTKVSVHEAKNFEMNSYPLPSGTKPKGRLSFGFKSSPSPYQIRNENI